MKSLFTLGLLLFAGATLLDAGDRNRVVRVVSVSQADMNRSAPDMLDETMERLERAGSFRPDIAALPELAIEGPPETALAPATARLAAWAKRNSSYVIFGTKTRRDGLPAHRRGLVPPGPRRRPAPAPDASAPSRSVRAGR